MEALEELKNRVVGIGRHLVYRAYVDEAVDAQVAELKLYVRRRN